MDEFESLSHTKWDCKYHVVFIPKRRRKTLYAELRRHLAEVFRRLCRIEEGASASSLSDWISISSVGAILRRGGQAVLMLIMIAPARGFGPAVSHGR